MSFNQIFLFPVFNPIKVGGLNPTKSELFKNRKRKKRLDLLI